MRFIATCARAATAATLLAFLAACGSSTSAPANGTPPQTQNVTGVQTPSQISVVTAK